MRKPTVRRRQPVRCELERAHGRARGRRVCHALDRGRHGAARPHAVARRSGSSRRRRIEVEQVEEVDRVGLPTDRCRKEWCRVQPSRSYALAYPRRHRTRERFDTPHLRQLPGGAFCVSPRAAEASHEKPAPSAPACIEPLFDNRWSGNNAGHAVQAASTSPWFAVGRRGMVLEWRTHATPTARRTRCLVAPPAHDVTR